MQNAFAGLRHKLIKKLSNHNKYTEILKWPKWLVDNP